MRIKWRHSSWRFSFAAFASLRLGENRRLNKEAHFSQRRKGGGIFSHKTFILAGRICRSVKNVKQIGCSGIPEIFINSQEEVERQFEALAEKCKSSNKNKLLLDFTEVPADISLVDRYDIGKRTLVFAQYKCKVAAVCKPARHDSQCFLETVAQNRWVDLRVFTNVEDALEWLLK